MAIHRVFYSRNIANRRTSDAHMISCNPFQWPLIAHMMPLIKLICPAFDAAKQASTPAIHAHFLVELPINV